EAKINTRHESSEFLVADITDRWPIEDATVDAAFSIFVLNEIENIDFSFAEFFRIMKANSELFLFVTHPGIALYWDTIARVKNVPNEKLLGNGGYFDRSECRYKFSIAN